ncbi:MAG: hypothetical protein RBR58_01245 [Candidatus Humimicrobiaceae bacterium]|jgi:hypothetical protein|nr:hypothetical protein [Actinomycetota bacterium]MDD5601146.1 hypothetical protein [Actinomycetota bacterium]MDY0027615.1 hypothetical protein [Candidatus Humimicrobiaceae bacterium]
MNADKGLSIANISSLSEKVYFLLQVSKKSEELDSFIKNNIPPGEKRWLGDLKSWKLNNKWLLKISDICLKDYDQVFFDCGEELLDLGDPENYQTFRERILEELL